MKLENISHKEYDQGETFDIYKIDTLNSANELKGFMLSLQIKFGEITDVRVKKKINDNDVCLLDCYDDLYIFFDSFDSNEFFNYGMYEFVTNFNEMYFMIDTKENMIRISDNRKLRSLEGTPTYEYYKIDFCDMILRLDMKKGRCARLTKNNKWILDYSSEDYIYDIGYRQTTIRDPLRGREEELKAQETERFNKAMEQYGSYCSEIII